MKLSFLTKDLDFELINGNMDIDIGDIGVDARENLQGKVFVAIHGFFHNGHDYVMDAAQNCAKAAIVSEDVVYPKYMTIIKVKDTKEALGIISKAFFGKPDEKLVTIGITGTKGKTSTAWYIREILNQAGKKCGMIGTIEIDDCGQITKSINTTPSSYEIYKTCKNILKNGGKYLVMEVSSQAIKEKRVFNMDFDYGVFTNISKDHIGPLEHKNFEEYKACKTAFINCCKERFIIFEEKGHLDLKDYLPFRNSEGLGIEFTLNDQNYMLNQPGEFTVDNALGAIWIGKKLGIDYEDIKEGLIKSQIPGRCQCAKLKNGAMIMVDYAHNGVALENLLKEISNYPHNRIITVFGCGGERDTHRREEMGKASARYSDLTVITQDNSRHEDPIHIMGQIAQAIYEIGSEYIIIEQREKAIEYAMEIAKKSDIIIVAGKGHEDYQIVGDKARHFDDMEAIKNLLKEKN